MNKIFTYYIVNFFGCIIFIIFSISLYRYQEIVNYSESLSNIFGSVSILMFLWYGIALIMYSFIASDSEKKETTNYKYNSGRSYSVTRNTGETIAGDEDGGRTLFKVYWILFPIYYNFWKELKILWNYHFTEFPNLNLIIKFSVVIGSFWLSIIIIRRLNEMEIPRLVIKILIYCFLIFYALLLIGVLTQWALSKP